MPQKTLNFIFFGTPEVASKTLQILKSNGYIPLLIITSPDKPSGRGLEMHETPSAIWAHENNIKCLKPEKLTAEFIESLPDVDLNIVVAYGKIIPEILINKPKLGTINIHYSLLPKYRGASPVEACLLNGDEETGVSIQQMEYKLDSGPIIKEEKIDIGINDNKKEIRETLINLGANLLCNILPEIEQGQIVPQKQDENYATFCKKIKKEDGELDLNQSGKLNWNKYRAYEGWPGTFFFINKGAKKIRIKIKWATFINNEFIIKRVIPEGKKEINYADYIKQNPL